MSNVKSGAELLQERRWAPQADGRLKDGDLYDLLMKEYGAGDRPDLRLPWFERVDKACQRGGPNRTEKVMQAMSRGKGKKNPARWFVATITRQFEDLGWM